MAAATTDQLAKERGTANKQYDTAAIVTNQTVYVGTICVFPPGSARVRNGVKTASYTVAGLVEEIVNDSGAAISAGTGNTAGTVRARFSYGQDLLMNIITAARTYTNINKTMLLSTNVDVDGTAVGTALVRIAVGVLRDYETAALGWIGLRVMGTGNAAG